MYYLFVCTVDIFQLLPLWMTLPALKCELLHSLRSFCVFSRMFSGLNKVMKG